MLQRLIIVRFGALGDIVLTTGTVSALKKHLGAAEIYFVTKAPFAPMLQSHPDIDEVIALQPGESLGSLRSRLKALNADAILDLHGKLRSRLLLGVAPRLVRWQKREWWKGPAVRMRLIRHRASMPMYLRYHRAAEKLLGQAITPQPMALFVDDKQQTAMVQLLVAKGIHLEKPLVGMSPGAMWATKRWPTEHFAKLAASLLDAGKQVLITGSKAEAALCEEIVAQAPGTVFLGHEDVSLVQLPALIHACDAYVANDSGPMHIARALRVPTVAIFGSTDPGQFLFDEHRLLFAHSDCSPCSLYGLRKCPRGDLRCLHDISPEAALSAVLAAFDNGGQALPVLG